ncbi:hypothetical protein [Rhodanobacter lindaniclasticus]|jgi:hypothetical protein|uniref:Uncharacterized protein n=1 Tax=Rhodanobacter lindaniclasticus TaxID=75310 RepID=A0A4S3KD99_9GAMM|nr:hypothetical protein [Rhodanobacter lindaniclasticus]THD06198.1 hypothetical protein B1991_14065 [Rhodanobacter lindaniclasticus]
MSSLWTDLLFLHGHITDARLARRLDAAKRPAPPPTAIAPAKSAPGWLWRLCQGIGDGQLRRQ